MIRTGKPTILIVAGMLLGLSACEDGAANAKADAEARENAAATEKTAKTKAQVAHNIGCLAALRWQKAALATAGIGDVQVYDEYFSEKLDAALGSQMISEPPAPMLSRSTIPDYLDWAYPDAVKTRFTAGKDENGDGTVSGAERNAPGFNTVASCVLEVAEAGKGALAGNDKVARAARIEALRGKLTDKGA
jgi:hypothetical protein